MASTIPAKSGLGFAAGSKGSTGEDVMLDDLACAFSLPVRLETNASMETMHGISPNAITFRCVFMAEQASFNRFSFDCKPSNSRIVAAHNLTGIPVQLGELTALTLTPEIHVKRISYRNPDRDPIVKMLEQTMAT